MREGGKVVKKNEEKGGFLLARETGKAMAAVSHPRMQVISHTVVDGRTLVALWGSNGNRNCMQCISSKVSLLFGMEASSVDLISMN